MANGWTPERRARQAELICNWQPWQRSTGPKTAAGKTKSARNSYKGAWRTKLRQLSKLLREMRA
jgi:ribosomal protein L19E